MFDGLPGISQAGTVPSAPADTRAIAPGATDTAARANSDTAFVFRSIPQSAFSIGEKIVMSVRYMGFPCAELTMTVADMETYRGRPVYVCHVHARTNRAFAFIYELSDTLTTYIDAEGLFSWKYTKEYHERKMNVTVEDTIETNEYDQAAGQWRKNGEARGTIFPFTQDMVSTFYYLRSIGWDGAGDTIRAPVNDTKKNYQMMFELGESKEMHVLREKKPVRVGKPILELEGKYQQIGNNEVWFTDDDKRIPVLIQSHVKLGKFYAKLTDYVPGQKSVALTDTPEAKR